jgi:dienelactone hydrolase
MRPLEIIIIILAALTALAQLLPALRHREERILLPVTNAVLIVAHLAGEGYRWQMVPVYVVVLGQLIVGTLPLLWPFKPAESLRTAGGVLSLVAVLVGGLLAAAMPVFSTPQPAGPYEVGTVTYTWVDDSRTMTYGPNPDAPREIVVQLWYPTETTEDHPRAPWVQAPRAYGQAMAGWVGLPGFITGHFNLVETHSYEGAPLLAGDGQLPVLVSVHGWAGFRSINQDQSEALASHGYVVIAANHTYGALMTDLPDGRLLELDLSTIPNVEEVGEEAYKEGINQLVTVYGEDTRFMLDQLEELNAADPAGRFTGRLELARVGYFGHSTGGGAAVEICAVEPRCAAVFGQDAWVEPVSDAVIAEPGAQPLFLMDSSTWAVPDDENFQRQRDLLANSPTPVGLATINGTAHYDFTMVPLISPIAPVLGLKGPLDGDRVAAINAAYLRAFFDEYLLGQPTPLMQGESPAYPEVEFLE